MSVNCPIVMKKRYTFNELPISLKEDILGLIEALAVFYGNDQQFLTSLSSRRRRGIKYWLSRKKGFVRIINKKRKLLSFEPIENKRTSF